METTTFNAIIGQIKKKLNLKNIIYIRISYYKSSCLQTIPSELISNVTSWCVLAAAAVVVVLVVVVVLAADIQVEMVQGKLLSWTPIYMYAESHKNTITGLAYYSQQE